MLVHRLRFVLPLVSAAMLLGSLGLLAWAVLVPCRVDRLENPFPTKPTRHVAPTVASNETANKASQDGFQSLSRRRFQRPLFDPPPPAPPVVEKKIPPPPPLKLLATMPEPGGGRAVFSNPQGTIITRAVGEEIVVGTIRVKVDEIANDHVILHQEDRTVTLKLGKE